MRIVPETANRKDWPRLVAKAIAQLQEEVDMNNPVALAERVVQTTYGEAVSVKARGKNLNKFGRNRVVGTTFETVAEFQGTTANETFLTTNGINAIVSDNAGDTTQSITIEGHTIDGSGNLTFATQTVALNGQTEVALTTPLARATRAFVTDSGTFGTTPAALAGNVYIYDNTGGITAGVPNTASDTKLLLLAGETQTEKAATAISSTDYWFVTRFTAGVGQTGGAANYVTCRMEIRDVANGGAWRPLGVDIVLVPGQNEVTYEALPYFIVPKNHDWRIRARCDANTAEVFAEAQGHLAAIQ